MRPNEIERRACGQVAEGVGIGGIEALADVLRKAWDTKFTAYVGACAAPGHWIKDVLRVKKHEQIADEIAAAISWVTAVAILTGAVEVVETGQMRYWAGVSGRLRKPGINRLVCIERLAKGNGVAVGGVKWIDRGIDLHDENSFGVKGAP